MSRGFFQALPSGSIIQRYTIHGVLGQGGFGITYLAHDANLSQPVAIKEYLPTDLCWRNTDDDVVPFTKSHRKDFRWGLNRFITEAQTLSRFEHPNIVSVFSVFEMNRTAYMVMRYEDGSSLSEILDRGATLDENWLKKMVLPILDGLGVVHAAGFTHRDIKPGNIYIRKDHSPVLLDFGSARRTEGVTARTLTTLVSPGYAPFEQYYARSDKQGPWTDIYGLGATLYRATVGTVPCDAIARSEALLSGADDPYVPATRAAAERYSVEFLCAIDRALSFREEKRPQDLAGWKRELEGELLVIGSTVIPAASARPVATQEIPDTRPPADTRNRWRGTRLLKAAVPIAAVAGLAAWVTTYQPPVIDADAMRSAISFQADAFTPESPVDQGDDVDRLLQDAWRDLGEARFIGPGDDNALARLRRVLEIDADNEQARNGMGILHTYFLSIARRAVDEGAVRRAVRHARQAAAASMTEEERAASRQLIFDLRKIGEHRAMR